MPLTDKKFVLFPDWDTHPLPAAVSRENCGIVRSICSENKDHHVSPAKAEKRSDVLGYSWPFVRQQNDLVALDHKAGKLGTLDPYL